MRTRLLVLFTCAAAALSVAQSALTNDDIIKMAKAGLSESILVTTINSQPGKYSTSVNDLVALKSAGVGDKAIAAMISAGSGAPVAAASAPAAAPSSSPSAAPADTDIPQGADIGVYYRKADQWEEMLPEVVNWKTGGVLKSIATAGVVKGDVNGHINGAHSRNSVKSPIEVFIYSPEGVAITEYQLIHLRDTPDGREFRTVTGGVMHASGGATRDLIPFEGKKVASRMYKVVLPNLGAGDYGFLPPGAFGSANSASIGKMYTFRLIE
jgi:hypothetical protein